MAQLSDFIRSGIRAEDLTGLPPDLQRALEPLFKYINNSFQGVAQALSRNVSLTDNLNNEIRTVTLSHGTAQLVSLRKLAQAKGVRSISVGSADGKTQHALAFPLQIQGTTVPNQVKITAYFLDSTAVRVPVTFELTPEGSYSALSPSTGVWTAPTLQNSWVNFDAANNSIAGYMKDALGFVHLRGTVKSGTVGLTIFTLPTGYIPSRGVNFAVPSNGAFGICFVDASGNVKAQAGSNVYFDLDGITFDTRA